MTVAIMIDELTSEISIKPRRSYGEKLLRAAAKGEDWADIKREDPEYYLGIDAGGASVGEVYAHIQNMSGHAITIDAPISMAASTDTEFTFTSSFFIGDGSE